MALTFPASPTVGDLYTAENGVVYEWNGVTWDVEAAGTQYWTGGNSAISYVGDISVGGSATFADSVGVPVGSAVSPSVYFDGDADTGVYSPGANQVAIATGGNGRVFIDSSGNVGIGTQNPGAPLEIGSSTDTSTLRLRSTFTTFGSVADISCVGTGNETSNLAFSTRTSGVSPTERMRITSDGSVGIGTSSPGAKLHVNGDALFAGGFDASSTTTQGLKIDSNGAIFNQRTNGISTLFGGYLQNSQTSRIGADGSAYFLDKVGIGTTSPGSTFEVKPSASLATLGIQAGTINSDSIRIQSGGTTNTYLEYRGYLGHAWFVNATEAARIDSSGRLLVGTSTARSNYFYSTTARTPGVQYEDSGSNTALSIYRSDGLAALYLANGDPSIGSNSSIGGINFVGNDGSNLRSFAKIQAESDGNVGTGDVPGRLVFSTTADGASSPTERARLTSDGDWLVGKEGNNTNLSTKGVSMTYSGKFLGTTNGSSIINVNRLSNDGNLAQFYQATNLEGTISVSGTDVSLNGATLSRWSQLAGGVERIEILRGSVLSNLDEMCEWGDEDNEQMNRMKVSDVEGDINVAGVFRCWDDDDDTYTNDFYCAMTGDFVIRIAQGTTVVRGDLLMSAGDGTAKPQDDDLVRSCTVAKVTSTTVSCTHPDGSYCVPCVLMAC